MMAKWTTKLLEELLQDINEVPYTDNREREQLSILMKGVAMINNKAMDNAAVKIRKNLQKWKLDSVEGESAEAIFDDNEMDELTRLRPIK